MNKPQILKAKHLSFLLVIGAVSLAVSGCASRLDTRGNLLDPERVEEIKPGEQTREEVAEILGSPSSITAFGSDTWYYISKRTATFAFFAPEVTERQILVVKFSKDGKVSAVDKLSLDAGRKVIHVDRTTPTHGNKMTAIEQLIGNLGRFKKKKEHQADQESEY